ncbi:MAG: hypothetical protein WC919_02995 [Candidatus Paceibacterota bacterium]|jgi:hypothetical protein
MTTDFVDVPVIDGSTSTVKVAIPKPLHVLDGAIPPPNHGVLHIMNPKDGDKRIVWDSGSLAEIRAAKEMFDDLVEKGLSPFRVGTNGKASSDKMQEFDPMAEQVIFIPVKLARAG